MRVKEPFLSFVNCFQGNNITANILSAEAAYSDDVCSFRRSACPLLIFSKILMSIILQDIYSKSFHIGGH